MSILEIFAGVLVALFVTWVMLIAVLFAAHPNTKDLRAAARLGPDVARLVRALATDREVARPVRIRLWLLVGYLALPFDLISDFIPVVGFADDVIITILVLRGVVRRAGASAIEQHWRGTPEGLQTVRRFAGIDNVG